MLDYDIGNFLIYDFAISVVERKLNSWFLIVKNTVFYVLRIICYILK